MRLRIPDYYVNPSKQDLGKKTENQMKKCSWNAIRRFVVSYTIQWFVQYEGKSCSYSGSWCLLDRIFLRCCPKYHSRWELVNSPAREHFEQPPLPFAFQTWTFATFSTTFLYLESSESPYWRRQIPFCRTEIITAFRSSLRQKPTKHREAWTEIILT